MGPSTREGEKSNSPHPCLHGYCQRQQACTIPHLPYHHRETEDKLLQGAQGTRPLTACAEVAFMRSRRAMYKIYIVGACHRDMLAWQTFLRNLHMPPDNIVTDTFSSTDFAKALCNLLTSGAIISLNYPC